MPGPGKEGVELKAGGGKVAGRKQTRKPGIYRFETAMGKMSDCQVKGPQLIPQVSIAAHAEGLDGLVGTTTNKKAKPTTRKQTTRKQTTCCCFSPRLRQI